MDAMSIIKSEYVSIPRPTECLTDGVVPERKQREGTTHFVSWKFNTRQIERLLEPSGSRLNLNLKQYGSWYPLIPDEVPNAYEIGAKIAQAHREIVIQDHPDEILADDLRIWVVAMGAAPPVSKEYLNNV